VRFAIGLVARSRDPPALSTNTTIGGCASLDCPLLPPFWSPLEGRWKGQGAKRRAEVFETCVGVNVLSRSGLGCSNDVTGISTLNKGDGNKGLVG
jgi:hypothetical protein